jgi:hypothetical protein
VNASVLEYVANSSSSEEVNRFIAGRVVDCSNRVVEKQ